MKKKNSNKIKESEKKLNEKDIIINNLIKKVDGIENNYKELYIKFEKEINDSIIIDSIIIKNKEINLIKEGIMKNFNKNIKGFELLLRGSRDGFEVKDFHSKCNGKDYTITFVETTKGKKFGGFTEETWDQSSDYKKGPKSFIFSLDNGEIYYNKGNRSSIFCYPSNDKTGLAFGEGHDFKLFDKCNENSKSYDNSGKSFDTFGKAYPLIGENYFYV